MREREREREREEREGGEGGDFFCWRNFCILLIVLFSLSFSFFLCCLFFLFFLFLSFSSLDLIFSTELGPHYLFDIYINRRNEVTLIDLCVNHEKTTDPKMFTWSELIKWESESERESERESESGGGGGGGGGGGSDHEGLLDVRFVEKENEALPSQLPQHRVPADMVGDPKIFMNEFIEATRRGDFDMKKN